MGSLPKRCLYKLNGSDLDKIDNTHFQIVAKIVMLRSCTIY